MRRLVRDRGAWPRCDGVTAGAAVLRARSTPSIAYNLPPTPYNSSTAYTPRWSDGYICGSSADGLSNASPASATRNSCDTKM